MRRLFTGCGTALVTPFNADGSVDEGALRALVDWQIEEGIHFLVPCGSTGEAATMPGTCSCAALRSSMVSGSGVTLATRCPPLWYSASIWLVPMDWICCSTYCLPVMPIVTTRISEAVPMTMPRAVSAKRTLLLRKVS